MHAKSAWQLPSNHPPVAFPTRVFIMEYGEWLAVLSFAAYVP
jgi:hypothetical protein